MDITEYLKTVNIESQQIFSESLIDTRPFGRAHHLAACIYEFSELLYDKHEKQMLTIVSAQLESATINLALGLYRQAYSSLRLAFEIGLSVVSFSLNKLDHFEWLLGKNDIKWFNLVDLENGVLSKRFANAFFSGASEIVGDYNTKARRIYRELSEFVHGNNETWTQSGIKIKFNRLLFDQYFKLFNEVSEVIMFTLCCRYLSSFSAQQLDMISGVHEEMSHISSIREFFGGPK